MGHMTAHGLNFRDRLAYSISPVYQDIRAEMDEFFLPVPLPPFCGFTVSGPPYPDKNGRTIFVR